MWMRIRTRSPSRPCIAFLPTLDRPSAPTRHRHETTGHLEAESSAADRQHHIPEHIQRRAAIRRALHQDQRIVTERRERRVAAAKPGREEQPNFHTQARRLQREAHQKTEQNRSRHVDDQCPEGKFARDLVLNENAHPVARQTPGGATNRDSQHRPIVDLQTYLLLLPNVVLRVRPPPPPPPNKKLPQARAAMQESLAAQAPRLLA